MEYYNDEILTEEQLNEEETENEYQDWLYEQESKETNQKNMTLQELLMLCPTEIYNNLEVYSQTREGKYANIDLMKSVLDDFVNGHCSAQFLVDELAEGMKNAKKNLKLNKTQSAERI